MLFGTYLTTTTPAPIDVSQITTAITGSVSTGTILTVIAGIIGTGMAFVLMWWGARKIKSGALSAIFKGKLHF